MLVAIAYMRRTPDAGRFVRWCWKQGRELILVSIALNILTIAWPALVTNAKFTGVTFTEVGLCVLSAYYLFRSPRIADAFADFPPPPPPAASP